MQDVARQAQSSCRPPGEVRRNREQEGIAYFATFVVELADDGLLNNAGGNAK
jgi:hypothetical protein